MRLIDVRREERAPLAWAAGWFFCVLAGYYAIRPVREAYAVEQDSAGVSQLFLIVLGIMLAVTPIYGWVVGMTPKAWLPAAIYGFFAANLLAFHGAFAWVLPHQVEALRTIKWTFYVWVSVFNMLSVTLFWSAAVELFSPDQARRLFGPIAGAGALGNIAGSEIASAVAHSDKIPIEGLLWVPCALLIVSIGCAARLRSALKPSVAIRPPGGHQGASVASASQDMREVAASDGDDVSWQASFRGVVDTFRSRYLTGIGAWVIVVSVCATAVYMMLIAAAANETHDPHERVRWFARQNTWQGVLTFIGQTALASWLIRKIGVGSTLALLPAAMVVGFGFVGWHPSLLALTLFDIGQRWFGFALGVPAREVLFTTVAPSAKYRAKAFIDTVGKRAGDAASAAAYAAAMQAGWSLSAVSWTMLALAILLVALSLWLGRTHEQTPTSSSRG